MGLSPAMVEELLSHLSPVLDFRRLRPGDRFALDFHPEGELRRLTYQTGPLEAVVISRDDEEWEVSERSIPSETKVATIRGTIESSLFESLEKLGEHDRLAMEFVDIFAWDIDFSHELHKGDTFRIVVEKVFRDGAFVTYGRVLAAQYRDREELHQAFSFPYPDEEGEYYSPEGKSVRRTFLRAPVSYSRISSGYSRQRLHPILKRRQPHLGVDYAAPAGTPVWAPADGKVVSKTSDRRNGRKLVLRHPNGYSTYFLHLSRFARGIKAGTKVKQKDVVGYVGSTGHSTGPHLDYRMKYNGRWLNPLRQKFPPGKPLPERYAAPFEEYKEWLTGQLETPSDTFIASLESSSD
jgi:murein DD-endopeptidase MepM/ murein hydrolase activator NlpD